MFIHCLQYYCVRYLDRQCISGYNAVKKEGNQMSITSDLLRGNTDTVLLALLESGDSYGYEINKSIKEYSGGEFTLKEATLYCAFKRLEESGDIESYWGSEAGGARRHYYRITDRGKNTLERSRNDWSNARRILDRLIFGKDEQI